MMLSCALGALIARHLVVAEVKNGKLAYFDIVPSTSLPINKDKMFSNMPLLFKMLRKYRRNQMLSREQLTEIKLAKFRELVSYVNIHSPWYADIIREHRIRPVSCLPSDFPPMDKSVLMDNFDRIVTDRNLTKQGIAEFLSRSSDPAELYLNRYHVLHTSGSSGQVGYFVFSKDDWVRGVAKALRRHPLNPRLEKKGFGRQRIAFFGAVGGHFGGVSLINASNRGLGKCFVKLALFEINSPLEDICARLNQFQPNFLFGYTTALTMLAAKQQEGQLNIAPIRVVTVGELMSAQDKARLQTAFGCPVSNTYAATEHLVMGASSPDGASMVLYDDDIFFDPHEDHLLTTNLFNFTLPLIRYRMSDVVLPIANRPGSAPYLEIESLVGRTELTPVFINQDGVQDFISPHTINEIFVKGVERFQLQLMSRTQFNMMVCLDRKMDAGKKAQSIADLKQRLSEILQQKNMRNVEFGIIESEVLPLNPKTRKFQLIVDLRANPTP